MTDSLAGRSARRIAEDAEAAANALERKSAFARSRAANYRKGAEGEHATAVALAELAADGWLLLHDRLAPTGGNVDHLLIGPGGVVVVDSKNWAGKVTITRGASLSVDGRSKTRDVASLTALSTTIERAVRGAGHVAPVYAVLSLTQNALSFGPTRLGDGPLVTGVADLVAAVRQLSPQLRPGQVDALVGILMAAFPAADGVDAETVQTQSPAHEPAGELFLRANIFLYVEPWSRSGHRRLYLNDDEGVSLGYRDLVADQIIVSVDDKADVVRGVLANAHSGGLALSRSQLPKIPVRIPGGRLLGHLGRLWSSYLVAQHWRKGSKDRLYVTHVVMDRGIFDLGHVDLGDGTLHPSSGEPLADDVREPVRYLERVLERYPRGKR
jgi:hypothetical protein